MTIADAKPLLFHSYWGENYTFNNMNTFLITTNNCSFVNNNDASHNGNAATIDGNRSG